MQTVFARMDVHQSTEPAVEMNKFHCTTLYSAVALIAWSIAGPAAADSHTNLRTASNEIVIGLVNRSPSQRVRGNSVIGTFNLLYLIGEGANIEHEMAAADGIVVSLPPSGDIDAVLTRLNARPEIFAAERNIRYQTFDRPNDPKLSDMWFLDQISAFEGWKRRKESPGIIVAVIDSGIQINHEDLRSRIWKNPGEIPGNGKDDDQNGYVDDVHGWNFFKRNNNPDASYGPVGVRSRNGGCTGHPTKRVYETHGTHVAGTIGAAAGNGLGVAGISHNVRIMALKALDGLCGAGNLNAIMEAVAYATKNGADVINLSLGGGGFSKLLKREIQLAIENGVSVVAAAGNAASNNDRNPRYPANYKIDGLITVAATNSKKRLAKFSNFGRSSVDLAAPGVDILNTTPGKRQSGRATSAYRQLSGTSMAAPMVAGAVALLRAEYPRLSPADIERRILAATDSVPALKNSVRSGGHLNLAKVLTKSAPKVAPRPTIRDQGNQSIGGVRIEGGRNTLRAKKRDGLPASGEITGKSLY